MLGRSVSNARSRASIACPHSRRSAGGAPVRSTSRRCLSDRRQALSSAPSTLRLRSEQTGDAPVLGDLDVVRRRCTGKSGHGHDLAAHRNHELGTCRQTHITHGQHMNARRALDIRIGRKAILGLSDAYWQMPETLVLQRSEAVYYRFVGLDGGGTVEPLRNRAELVPERHLVRIKQAELGLPVLGKSDDGARETDRSLAAARPMVG